jgi:hypothetical protein
MDQKEMAMWANMRDDVGYVFFLSDKFHKNAPIYIGWASREAGAVTRFLTHMRKQSPDIEMIYFCAGTVQETIKLRMALRESWAGSGEWFTRTAQITDYLAYMIRLHCVEPEEDDDCEEIVERKPARFTRQHGRKVSRYK